MAEDVLVVKPPKASSFLSRIMMLVFAMACGVYICSIYLKQSSVRTKTLVEIIDAPCDSYRIRLTEAPYLHYPHPQTFMRAECKDNPVRYFVIISVQRSGSGWFETLLNSHVNVSSNGEIFSVKERRSTGWVVLPRTLDRVYNLDWMGSASKNECSAAVGFKWMLNQIHESRRLLFSFERAFIRFMGKVPEWKTWQVRHGIRITFCSSAHRKLRSKHCLSCKPKMQLGDGCVI